MCKCTHEGNAPFLFLAGISSGGRFLAVGCDHCDHLCVRIWDLQAMEVVVVCGDHSGETIKFKKVVKNGLKQRSLSRIKAVEAAIIHLLPSRSLSLSLAALSHFSLHFLDWLSTDKSDKTCTIPPAPVHSQMTRARISRIRGHTKNLEAQTRPLSKQRDNPRNTLTFYILHFPKCHVLKFHQACEGDLAQVAELFHAMSGQMLPPPALCKT